MEYGKGEYIKKGSGIAIIAIGKMVEIGYDALIKLNNNGINPSLINMRFLKPIDSILLNK
ncbi:MAG: transketolase C-terminal domain-containing protein, partial [Senegalia sp. (in: firmicutes)]